MLIDQHLRDDIFVRGHLRDARIDPILHQLDHLLDDDQLCQMVCDDFSHRRPCTLTIGWPSTPGESRLAHACCPGVCTTGVSLWFGSFLVERT